MPIQTLTSTSFVADRPRFRLIRTLRLCVVGIVAGIRLFRAAPSLGDVGTNGAELSRWITERNDGRNGRIEPKRGGPCAR